MRVGLVEDNPLAQKQIIELLEKYFSNSRLECEIETFETGSEFLAGFKPHSYDLVLLDYCLPGSMTGMDIARAMREQKESCPLVFVTSSVEYALEGYEVNALAYLVKPLDYARLKASLDRILQIDEDNTILEFPKGYGSVLIGARNLKFCRSDKHNVFLHLDNGETVRLAMTFKELEERLNPYPQFFRSARGYLVNLSHVQDLKDSDFVLDSGELVPISRNCKQTAQQRYRKLVFDRMRG